MSKRFLYQLNITPKRSSCFYHKKIISSECVLFWYIFEQEGKVHEYIKLLILYDFRTKFSELGL